MSSCKSVIFICISCIVLSSCTSYKSNKKKMIAKWEGYAEIAFDSNYYPGSQNFPFSDSLDGFYKSFKDKNYIQIELNDSFAVVNHLSFYRNRVFTIDWTPLKAGKDYIVLWAYTTREDVDFRELLKQKTINTFDTMSGGVFCLELFDVTKDREILFLKDIKLKNNSFICRLEMDLVVAARQKLTLQKTSQPEKNLEK